MENYLVLMVFLRDGSVFDQIRNNTLQAVCTRSDAAFQECMIRDSEDNQLHCIITFAAFPTSSWISVEAESIGSQYNGGLLLKEDNSIRHCLPQLNELYEATVKTYVLSLHIEGVLSSITSFLAVRFQLALQPESLFFIQRNQA